MLQKETTGLELEITQTREKMDVCSVTNYEADLHPPRLIKTALKTISASTELPAVRVMDPWLWSDCPPEHQTLPKAMP